MAKTPAKSKSGDSLADSMSNLFTGAPVDVRVEKVLCTQNEFITHQINHASDFDPMDFYMPLGLFTVVYVLQIVFHAYFTAILIQIWLFYDIYKRINRRPSGRGVTGMHPPRQKGNWGQAFLIYFACLPFILGAIWVNHKLMQKFFPQPSFQELMRDGQGSFFLTALLAMGLIAILLEFFMTVVFAPLTEEMWFRGIGLAGFMRNGSVIRAVIVTSVIFGALHGPGRIIFATVFGLVMALIRFRTASLYCCMAVHAFHNFMAIAVGIYLVIREMQKAMGRFPGVE